MRNRLANPAFWGALALGVLAAATVWACSVPVFRYALERWPAEPYTILVFHRGPLPDAASKTVERLKEETAANTYGGVARLGVIDVSGEMNEAVAKIWQEHASATLPHLVVRFPEFYGIPINVWSGPLTDEAVTQVLDSPARRQVARRLLESDSAVFVLLESGNAKQDDAAARLVEAQLKELQEAIELPAPPGGFWDDPVYDSEGPPQLTLKFSVLRLKRDDPAEGVFVNMLLGTEPDLRDLKETMVFPLFGRGRALCALVGKGINKENLEEIGFFLAGPCSCTVKYQNPGVDMFFTVDWDAALAGEESAIPEVTPPPLTGLAAFKDAQNQDQQPQEPQKVRRTLFGMISRIGFTGPIGFTHMLVFSVVAGLIVIAIVSLIVWKRQRARAG
ncbi:MAG TPA: hypothetical protein VM238_22670 [Phycisphaerae bacterium]|nr:hypothetical protein [Phycisphaerae bacterium]